MRNSYVVPSASPTAIRDATLSAVDAARAAGISAAYLSKLENDAELALEGARGLLRAFGRARKNPRGVGQMAIEPGRHAQLRRGIVAAVEGRRRSARERSSRLEDLRIQVIERLDHAHARDVLGQRAVAEVQVPRLAHLPAVQAKPTGRSVPLSDSIADAVNFDRVPRLQNKAAHLKESMKNEIIRNLSYAHEHGTDRSEISDWNWPG